MLVAAAKSHRVAQAVMVAGEHSTVPVAMVTVAAARSHRMEQAAMVAGDHSMVPVAMVTVAAGVRAPVPVEGFLVAAAEETGRWTAAQRPGRLRESSAAHDEVAAVAAARLAAS